MSNIYVSNWIANLILKRIPFFTIVLLLQIINNDNRLKFTFLYRQGRRGRGATWFRFRSTRWQRPRTRFERGNTRCRIDACNDPKEPNIITETYKHVLIIFEIRTWRMKILLLTKPKQCLNYWVISYPNQRDDFFDGRFSFLRLDFVLMKNKTFSITETLSFFGLDMDCTAIVRNATSYTSDRQ